MIESISEMMSRDLQSRFLLLFSISTGRSCWIGSAQYAVAKHGESRLPQQGRTIGAAKSVGVGIVSDGAQVDVGRELDLLAEGAED